MNILDICGELIKDLVAEKEQLQRDIYLLAKENTLLRAQLFEYENRDLERQKREQMVDSSCWEKKKDIVQTKNPRSNRYVKVDRTDGRIISHKRNAGPYKNVSIVLLKTPEGQSAK